MPINKITEEQFNVMQRYINMYALPDSVRTSISAPVKDILKVWNREKQDLFKMFGGELTLSKKVSFSKSPDMLCGEINDKFLYSSQGWEFLQAYRDLTRRGGSLAYNYQAQGLIDAWWLANGVYDDDEFTIPLPDGTIMRVQKGAKIMKLLGKIAKAFDLPGFEEFRIAHSQILNQKRLTGNLSISIHPFDYMTMSHNNSGWNSCMDWTDDGSYRRGTVEMMNSKCVVVAYLDASKEFHPLDDDFVWNNKKWRQLFIVDKNVITGVKPYPYYNEDLDVEVLKWLRELAEKNMGWHYTKDIFTYDHDVKKHNEELDKEIILRFWTDAMYNDFCNDHRAYLSPDIPEVFELTYSGPSQCLNCGGVHVDFEGEGMLICEDCDYMCRCDNCGERHDPDYMYELGNGQRVCRYCYETYTEQCSICEDTFLKGEVSEIHLASDDDHIDRFQIINLCDECLRKFYDGDKEDLFKVSTFHSTKVEGKYGRIYYLKIEELTSAGLKMFGYENPADALIDFKETNDSSRFYVRRDIYMYEDPFSWSL